jgi:pimeloyl-ACP methyl ester carboxylesterase
MRSPFRKSHLVSLATLLAASLAAPRAHAAEPSPDKPTIVLVHGAFAESSSWDGVIRQLSGDGYRVVAVANPLRGVDSDSIHVARIVDRISGSLVLVGHSYGGMVISNAARGNLHVQALVFVSAFAPDEGETALQLTTKYPGSTLSTTLAPPVSLGAAGKELFIDQARFPMQFAADLPLATASIMAATQRPILDTALTEPSSVPAWKSLPSWFIYGSEDRNIPPAALAFMARRAGAKKTVVIPGASHVVMTSHPDAIAELIEEAARGHSR